MSIRAIPLLLFVFIAYNVIVLIGGGGNPDDVLRVELIKFPMLYGNYWSLTTGDVLTIALFILLFFELIKSTYTSNTSLVDHALSMVVFVVCLVEFLLVRQAQTSVFFFIVVASLIDVIAGYTIGIRLARRDFTVAG